MSLRCTNGVAGSRGLQLHRDLRPLVDVSTVTFITVPDRDSPLRRVGQGMRTGVLLTSQSVRQHMPRGKP